MVLLPRNVECPIRDDDGIFCRIGSSKIKRSCNVARCQRSKMHVPRMSNRIIVCQAQEVSHKDGVSRRAYSIGSGIGHCIKIIHGDDGYTVSRAEIEIRAVIASEGNDSRPRFAIDRCGHYHLVTSAI